MTEISSVCDVCSHDARPEIDDILYRRLLAEEKKESVSSLADLTSEIHRLIEEKYPDTKRVPQYSIESHYKNHELAPNMALVDIDYDRRVVRVGDLALPMRTWQDGIRIAWTIALWNLCQNPKALGPKHFIDLSKLLAKIEGKTGDELQQYLQELIEKGPTEKSEGPMKPEDAKSGKKRKNRNG